MTGDASTPGYLNGDGFGLGWYSTQPNDPIPCVYRQARPAWNDPNLSSIAEKVYTRVLFAHVRAASPGLDVSETTCHPFRHGRYLWMHNGGLGCFNRLRRRILSQLGPVAFDYAVTHGSSDTALCFAIFLDQIEDYMAPLSPDTLRSFLQVTVATIESAVRQENDTTTSLLNFVVSDGETLVASRYVIDITDESAKAASLYYACGNSYQSDGSAPGNYAMMHTDRRPTLAILSSEPLTESRADWVPVPRNSCIVITKSMHILLSPIRAAPSQSPDDRLARILSNLTIPKTPKDYPVSPRLRRSERNSRPRELTVLSPRNAVICPVGTAVRATVSSPCHAVLCCTIMGHLLCSGGNNGLVHVWDIEENHQHSVLETGSQAVLALLASPDQRTLVVGTSASIVMLYHLVDGKRLDLSLSICCEGMGDVLSLALCGNSLFAGFSDAGLRCVVRDISTCDQTRELDSALTIPNSKTTSRYVTFADVGHEFVSHTHIIEHRGFIFALVPCLKGRFLCTGCGDGVLRIWDVALKECVQTRNDHSGAILALAVFEVPQGTMLFSGSRDCSVKVWVWDGNKSFICKRTLRKHKDEVIFLAVGGDKLVSGSADGSICVWCVDTMRLICQYRDHSMKAGALSYEHNSLFTASDEGNIQLRDIVSMETDIFTRDMNKTTTELINSLPSSVSFETQEPRSETTSSISMKNPTPKSDSPCEQTDCIETCPGWTSKNTHQLDLDDIPEVNCAGLSAVNMFLEGTKNKTYNQRDNGSTKDIIISEAAEEDSDDTEVLLPGVRNEVVLPPPMGTVFGNNAGSTDEEIDEDEQNNMCEKANVESTENGTICLGTHLHFQKNMGGVSAQTLEKRLMQEVLRKLISYPTVSTSPEYRESCWEGARYLGRFLEGMGASVKYVNTSTRGPSESRDEIPSKLSTKEARLLALESDSNPVVLARFASANPSASTITFYGHYDVMPAFDSEAWKTGPWEMEMKDGYLYGRGATDNKGPITAMIFAVKKLMEESPNGIGVNIVLVLQGEGEASNNGFKQCLLSHKHWFERTCLILTSNSTWIGEDRPCLTYGFRGIIELLVTVTGGRRNLHSGVDGGAIAEPMNDLISVVGAMVDGSGAVCIPGFYDDVRPLSEEDRERIKNLQFDLQEYKECTGVDRITADCSTELLESRWRKPSVSVTSIETTNVAGFFSVVPRSVSAKISIRFVPDQDPKKIEQAVREHLQYEVRKRRSPNVLKVECLNTGDWWIGDPNGKEFQIAARAVRSVWNVEPACVCEGGSMPLFSFLTETLDAPIVQVPLGQSTDGAHLPNERIRERNLYKGKEVLQHIVAEVAKRAVNGRIE